MTNDQIRMTKLERRPYWSGLLGFGHLTFVILSSFGLGHSSFLSHNIKDVVKAALPTVSCSDRSLSPYRKHRFMLEVTQQPRQYLLTWTGWRLEFSWQVDRWQHQMWRAKGREWTPAISSVEGTSEQPWPGSPAFQNVYYEQIDPDIGEVQLLGQSGKNHYSGAIRCDSKRQVIDFDLAVRIQAHPAGPLLLSTYDVYSPLGRDDTERHWELTIEPLPVQPLLVTHWDVSTLPLKSTYTLQMPDLTGVKIEKQRTTLRWKYQWRLKPVA